MRGYVEARVVRVVELEPEEADKLNGIVYKARVGDALTDRELSFANEYLDEQVELDRKAGNLLDKVAEFKDGPMEPPQPVRAVRKGMAIPASTA